MPKADEPRIVVRVSTADGEKLSAAAKVAGVGTSTLLREAAMRGDRYVEVGRELAREKSSAAPPTVAAPPADPVPPAASTLEQTKQRSDEIFEQISSPYTHRCPVHDCPTRSYIPTFICPIHGRRTTAAA